MVCPRVCPRGTNLAPSAANASQERKENPSASSALTEGCRRAPKLMRPLLCHLSYAADQGPEQKTYQAYGAGVKQSDPTGPQGLSRWKTIIQQTDLCV